jgi:23S rRNA (cytidine1920-2'-O)/16S rRNA (cytidine1409-2'-O)-methyltransferase
MSTERRRLDEVVLERGLAPTRSGARALIMAGLVLVGGIVADKAGAAVPANAEITLKERPRYVSRAGGKLAGALKTLRVGVAGRDALDVGASTGGFVDCLLQEGAARVIALDVGHGQLDARLRNDPRVVVMERVNARHLRPGELVYEPDLVTMDVSFISVSKLLPAVVGCLRPEFEGLILIKPQFEAGQKHVGKKGIVRDPGVHRQVLVDACHFVLDSVRLEILGVCRSPVAGVGGNAEFFLHVARGREKGIGLDRLEGLVEQCIGFENCLQGSE